MLAQNKSEVQQQISDVEWQTRVNLAAFYRLVDHHGMTDLIYNHITARIPDQPMHYLINPFGLNFEEIKASNLLTMNLDGDVIFAPSSDGEYNPAGPYFHGTMLAARPDLMCVAHVHTPAIMAVSGMGCGLLPIAQTAMSFRGRVGFHAFGIEEGGSDRLAADFADKDILILQNHGVLAGGRTIAEAFLNVYNFDFACRTQVLALAGEKYLVSPPEDVLEAHDAATVDWLNRSGGARDTRCIEWEAALRMLDRRNSDFRD